MRRWFDFLQSRDIPLMSRPSYIAELRYYLLWSLLVGAIEGNIAGIVAKKTFLAPDWLTSVIWALPVSANLVNLLWGVWLRGRRLVPSVRMLTIVVAIAVASVALISPAWGGWAAAAFAVQLTTVHLLMSGLLSLRVAIWRANYPKEDRARITARLQTVRMLFILLSSASINALFDHSPELYRWIYPGVAVVGLCSLIPLRRLRIRGESRFLRAIRSAGPDGGTAGWLSGLREAGAILRHDRPFARYMVAQFVMGSANFFTDAVLLTVLAGGLGLGYFTTSLLMIQIPVVVMLVAIRFWAPYFDRVGVVQFRVRNSGMWVASYVFVVAAMLCIEFAGTRWSGLALGLLVIGRLVNGMCRGGGMLAWSIGHLHFARPEQAELYMGIHVGLTGLRGLVIPPLGTLTNHLIGNLSFLVALGLSLVAFVLFWRMAREETRARRPATAPAEAAAADSNKSRIGDSIVD